jgi:hypothetical protein
MRALQTAEQAQFRSLENRVQAMQEDMAEMKQCMHAIAQACGGGRPAQLTRPAELTRPAHPPTPSVSARQSLPDSV